MAFEYCPRCGTQSFERLRSHDHCVECNYSPDFSPYQEKDRAAPIPRWVFKAAPGLSPSLFDRPHSEPATRAGEISSEAAGRGLRLTPGLRLAAFRLALFLSLGVAVGCATKEREKPPSQVVAGIFRAAALPSPDPNRYSVTLSWESAERPERWFIHRKRKDQLMESTQIGVFAGTDRSAVDETVEPGEEYTYFLATGDEDRYSLKEKATIAIPRDHVVTNRESLQPADGINRLFLRGLISTEGKSVTWDVREILAEQATLDSSPAKANLPPGAHGGSCGNVTIKAQRARGTLLLKCRAQDGTDGTDGRNGRDGKQGAAGVDGDVDVKPNGQIPVPMDAAKRAQLKHWYVTNTLPSRPVYKDDWERWFHCSRQPGNGAQGEAGENGVDGIHGGNGGSTGTVSIEIAEDSDFDVAFENVAGKAGTGGRGGNGGKGGPGGPPGKMDPSGFLCRPAGPGPKGPDGLNGRPGKYGSAGVQHPACVRIGGRETGDCSDNRPTFTPLSKL